MKLFVNITCHQTKSSAFFKKHIDLC